ncbi:LysR substrate-binding domain-containing protein [Microvirga sp. GCM10011540]|uniref:LysR substrate-binding domain-containing protein n=1 Tax=Microvirga sp. GCM10011540 TaxID=3317338 RepID=UPI0036176EEC
MKSVDIGDLEVFAAIARSGSFRKAATVRGVSASALSQTIRQLEERLGVRLLNRTTRSVALTQAGERLLGRLVPALDQVQEAVDEINSFRQTPTGTVRINAPAPAVEHILAPLINPFLKEYPEISLEIISDAAKVDIVAEGFDAGVRFGKQLARDMIAVPLGPSLRYVVVGSPDYLAKYGVPQNPADLLTHVCIRQRFPGGTIFTWEFEKGRKKETITPEGRLTLNDARHITQAAMDGLGLAWVLEDFVRPSLSDHRLVEVLVDWSPRIPSWYLYYPSRRHTPVALRVFLDFIRRNSHSNPANADQAIPNQMP